MGWVDVILSKLRPRADDLADEDQLWILAGEALEAGDVQEAVRLAQRARRAEANRRGYEWNPAFGNPLAGADEAAMMLRPGSIEGHIENLSTVESQTLRRILAMAILTGAGIDGVARNLRGLFWSGHLRWVEYESWRTVFERKGRWPHTWDWRLRGKPAGTDLVQQFADQISALSPEARAVLGLRIRPWHELQPRDAGREHFHWTAKRWATIQTEINEKLYSHREPTPEDVLACGVEELKSYCRTLKLPLSGKKADLQNRLRQVDAQRLREALPEVWAPAARLPWGKGDADIDYWIDYHNQVAFLFAHQMIVSNPEAKRRQLENFQANRDVLTGVRIGATDDPICEDLNGKGFLFSRLPRSLDKLPPHYPGCRCCLIPVTKTWKELLGDKAEGIQETSMETGTDWLD